jgi:hypothetical protein
MDKFFISEWIIHPSIKVSEVQFFGIDIEVFGKVFFNNFKESNTIYFVLKNEEVLKWKFNSKNQCNDALQELKNTLQNGTD